MVTEKQKMKKEIIDKRIDELTPKRNSFQVEFNKKVTDSGLQNMKVIGFANKIMDIDDEIKKLQDGILEEIFMEQVDEE